MGKIIEMNCLSGKGEILDSNEQEISFDLQDLSAVLDVGSRVFFEIRMSPTGLTAVKLRKIFLSKNSTEPVSYLTFLFTKMIYI